MNTPKLNHTPGQWSVKTISGSVAVVIDDTHTVAWIDFWTDRQCSSQKAYDEQMANARLIASAPDLLAENKRLRDALDNLIGCLRMVDGKPHICAASIQVASALEKSSAALNHPEVKP